MSVDLAWILVERERYADACDVAVWLGLLVHRYPLPPAVRAALVSLREALQASPPDPARLFRVLGSLRSHLRRAASR